MWSLRENMLEDRQMLELLLVQEISIYSKNQKLFKYLVGLDILEESSMSLPVQVLALAILPHFLIMELRGLNSLLRGKMSLE